MCLRDCLLPCGDVERVWDMEQIDILEAEQGDPCEGGAGREGHKGELLCRVWWPALLWGF